MQSHGARGAVLRGQGLPEPLGPIVGRGRERNAVAEALGRSRLVTLAGPGGVGKTRLALEVARGRAVDAWLVDLATVAEPSAVAAEAARVLGVGSGPGGLATALADARLVLLLDNCEHVIEACAAFAGALLQSCPGIRILATSREPLGLAVETVVRLEPLHPEQATRLFVERARRHKPELLLTGDAEATVARLCERLDGLPLAIELAAARVSLMSPAEILARLGGAAPVLGGASRLAPSRHRTLRSTLDWSYELLDAAERQAFRSLSVFVGGFDADAALAVTATPSLDVLARLVDKSLVAAYTTPRGTTRYRLLETIRERAAELLIEAGELDAARERQLHHLCAFADRALDEWLATGAQRLVNELDDDYENVRATLERCVAGDPCAGVRLLGGTRDLFFRFGQADGLRLAQALLERCPAAGRARAVALIAVGQLAGVRMELDLARRALGEAAALSAELGERALEAWTAFFLGMAETFAGATEAARERLAASREQHRALGNQIGEARALGMLGAVQVTAGDAAGGKELVEEALAIYVAAGDRWGEGASHTWLGLIAEAPGGDPARATRHLREAATLLGPSRDATLLPIALVGQACVVGRTDWPRAVRVAAAATAARTRVGGGFPPYADARLRRIRAGGEAALGADFQRVWSEGARLEIEDAVALAFGKRRAAEPSPAGLSARELEIAGLVAEGLSNKQIAARLQLSVRTVESHVRNALVKIGAGNRTRLATWARDRIQ